MLRTDNLCENNSLPKACKHLHLWSRHLLLRESLCGNCHYQEAWGAGFRTRGASHWCPATMYSTECRDLPISRSLTGWVFIPYTADALHDAVSCIWRLDRLPPILRRCLFFATPPHPSFWLIHFPLVMSTPSIRPQSVSSGDFVHFWVAFLLNIQRDIRFLRYNPFQFLSRNLGLKGGNLGGNLVN